LAALGKLPVKSTAAMPHPDRDAAFAQVAAGTFGPYVETHGGYHA